MIKVERIRQYILDKFVGLFNLNGYVGIFMKDIMEVIKMLKGVLYGYFQSKEEIVFVFFELVVDKVLLEVGCCIKVIDNMLDKLKVVVYFYKERILNFLVEGGCLI